ncbi:probable tRNA(His) guanylyltransferase [Microplitis mediator]|uniref:probable tRNA(His) guanylyltransferase n=1 Tax=Microplitis mediator TaxID=375433 RepID=UPI0025579629|nr:probable tRNA(His) guanylyltransferase [Microplitis mediator]
MRYLLNKLIFSVNTKISRSLKTSPTMAKSKFEYVREFERENICLPNCWIVVRVDGKNFSKFSDEHNFSKPNDIRALELMNQSAAAVMNEFPDVVLAYGQSDEYSFVFRKETEAYNRRELKLATYVSTLFSSAYTFHWSKFCLNPLKYPPSFDARVVLYPSDKNLRDYLSWRQADVHINNLYNTCFWNLVQKKNMTPAQAQEALKGTVSSDKNELLFHSFNINYNNEPEIFRKGSTLIKKLLPDDTGELKPTVITLNSDIIGDKFWEENPQILDPKAHKNKTNGAKKKSSLK